METLLRKWWSFAVFIVLFADSKGQSLEIGTSLGSSTYQGDISPFSWQLSFQGSKLAQGILLGYSLNEVYSVKMSYYHTSLSASDKDALDDWRQSRNLSFRTQLSEWSLHLDIEPLDYFFKSHKLKPNFHLGVGLFRFNPQTKYNGKYIDLQPLGTEGQGIPGSGRSPYSLTQLVIPVGLGLKYYINDQWNIEISINPRKTFTDYLDDVSNYYYDRNELIKHRGRLAAELAYRGDEIDPSSGYPTAGSGRGNTDEKDWYILNTFTITYRLDTGWPFKSSRKVKCPF